MYKRMGLLLMLFLLVIINSNVIYSIEEPSCVCGGSVGECSTCTSKQAGDLTSDQLSQPGTLQQVSDLNQLNPDALSRAMNKLYGTSDFNLNGQSATISGSTLTVSGSTIDLSTMNGASISVSGNDVTINGQKFNSAQGIKIQNGAVTASSLTYYSSGQTTVINAEDASFSPNAIQIGQADSVSYEGSTSTKVVYFTAESGTFRISSADLVIVEF